MPLNFLRRSLVISENTVFRTPTQEKVPCAFFEPLFFYVIKKSADSLGLPAVTEQYKLNQRYLHALAEDRSARRPCAG